jgi:hypothetical protein
MHVGASAAEGTLGCFTRNIEVRKRPVAGRSGLRRGRNSVERLRGGVDAATASRIAPMIGAIHDADGRAATSRAHARARQLEQREQGWIRS